MCDWNQGESMVRAVRRKGKQSYIGHENVCQGPHKRILLVIPFPKTFAEFKMTGKNTILDDFEALSQIVRYLMRSNATVGDHVAFG
jgi:hypothetical protein